MNKMTEELSLKQKEAVEELKRLTVDEVPPQMKDDIFLYLRFLRARDFNINMAEAMLRNHLIWRKANQIDNILQYTPPDVNKGKEHPTMSPSEKERTRMGIVQKYLPFSRMGIDKEGAPVRYFAFGEMDAKGILKCVNKSVCIKSVLRDFEEDVAVMKEQSKKLGRTIEQWTYIFNFENYTFAKATHKPTLETLIALFLAYEANYPERLKRAYIINASVYFSIVFSVIKPLLSGATISKITIYGKDGWKEELLKCIDENELPAFLGGKKTDPDGNPMCSTFLKHGVSVPEELYALKSNKRLCTQEGVQKLTIARKAKVNLNLNVEEPGSVIEWEFETDGRDIGFGLLYSGSNCNDDAQELVPNQRIDTHIDSEVGAYKCKYPGTYILVFDNTYSWIHQKDVYYKASVTNPIRKAVY